MLKLQINGKRRNFSGSPFKRLIDVLREDFGLTGTKEGCGEGECGACTVLIDGEPVNSCLVPVCQAQGCSIQTIESLGTPKKLNALQQSFLEKGGAQCGICTPGMLMTAWSWIKRHGSNEPDAIRTALAGNLCRCTGYQHIIESVVAAVTKSKSGKKLAFALILALAPLRVFARSEKPWSTFRSEAVGVQIDAPADWKQETGDRVLRLLPPDSRDTGASITVSRQPGGLAQATNVSKAAISSQGGKIREEKDVTISGHPAHTIVFLTVDGLPVRGKMSFIDLGGRILMVDCEANKRDYSGYESAFERAISSLVPIGAAASASQAPSSTKSASNQSPTEESHSPSSLDSMSSSQAVGGSSAMPNSSAPTVEAGWVRHRDNRTRILASAPSDWQASATEGLVLGARRQFLFLHPADWQQSRARVAVFSRKGGLEQARAWAKSAVSSLKEAKIQRAVTVMLPSGRTGYVVVFNEHSGPNAELGILTSISSQGRVLITDCRAKSKDFASYNDAFNKVVESVAELEPK